MISIRNLSFAYDGSKDVIFDDVNLTLDESWKLGFIGRNGRGKTTFLNLLLGKYEYKGTIKANVNFDYFPLEVKDYNLNGYEIAEQYLPSFESWQLEREIGLLEMDYAYLERPFNTLSAGEKTKVLLAILFLKEHNFLLIDEPTNHLDVHARKAIASYLQSKSGFILVSHDRNFIDECVDHILSLNKTNIDLVQGNFSSWYFNKTNQDNYEINRNEKLRKDINRLEKASRQTAEWSNKVEKSKTGAFDKGYVGHMAAKMMKKSLNTRNRQAKAIEEKSKLLKNIETTDDLKLAPLHNRKGRLIEVYKLGITYNEKPVFENLSFYLEDGERIQLKGKNGCGKSSVIKLLLGEKIEYKGNIYQQSNLVISYISQDTSNLKGTLKEYVYEKGLDEALFLAILRKLGFEREQFEQRLENYSEGQKKKVLIAHSLCMKAHIYIWDEPLNYIDIFSRIQLENLILEYQPTMIFVEHDEAFAQAVASKVVEFEE